MSVSATKVLKVVFFGLLAVTLVFAVAWAGTLMFGVWTMVADGSRLVYH